MARCLECVFLHKVKGKDRYFCLNARDYIEHEIDENIGCDGFKPISK